MKTIFIPLLIILSAAFQTLNAQTNPALVKDFKINGDTRNGYHVNWTVANNEVVNKFELQKSINGNDFVTIVVLTASAKLGIELYQYNETAIHTDKVMYRLKMLSRGLDIYYSKIILFKPKFESDNNIKVIGNPVNDKLTLSFDGAPGKQVDLKIYSMNGNIVHSQKITTDRNNILAIPLSATFKTGMYAVEISNGIEKQTARFIKQ